MSAPIDSFKNRLYTAMQIRGVKQVELSEMTGISKSSINQYLSGYARTIKTDKIQLIADALDLNPAWLVGYDVPMEKSAVSFREDVAKKLANAYKDETIYQILDIALDLDLKNKEALLNYAMFLKSQVKE